MMIKFKDPYTPLFAGLYTLSSLMVLSMLWMPLGRDQGIFAWAADEILRGRMPYSEVWEVKGPASFYIYAAAQWLFGRNMWGIRVLDICFLAISSFFLWRLLKRLDDSFAAHVSVLFYISLWFRLGYGSTAEPDVWASMLLVVAFSILLGSKRAGYPHFFLAGVFLGTTLFFKSVFILFFGAFVVFALLMPGTHNRRKIYLIASMGAGAILVTISVLIWLYNIGALRDFLEIQLDFNRLAHMAMQKKGLVKHVFAIGVFADRIESLIVFVSLGMIYSLRRQEQAFWFLLSLTILGFGFALIQGRYYTYHWSPMFGVLSVFGALGLSKLKKTLETSNEKGRPRNFATVAFVWTCVGTVFIGLSFVQIADKIKSDIRHEGAFWHDRSERFQLQFGMPGKDIISFLSDKRVADHISARTQKDDRIEVWAVENRIYYLADRPSATRFGYNYPLVRKEAPYLYKKYRQEFIRDLKEMPPIYIVVKDGDKGGLHDMTSKEYIEEFPEFRDFIRKNYFLEKVIDLYQIWRLSGQRKPILTGAG